MQEEREQREEQVGLQPSYNSSAQIESMHALVDELMYSTGSKHYSGTDLARILAM